MGVHIELFNINHNLTAVARGTCLISEPFSPDSFFGRSVILITEHSEEDGTVGYILNKPVEVPFNELFPDFPDFATVCYIGGPVNPESVHFIHTRPDLFPDSQHILENIFWGGNFNQVKEYIENGLIKPREIRIFLGYSGWAPRQLRQEIEDKYWVVSDIQAKTVMNADNNTWKEVLMELGDSYALWAKSPMNPGMN